MTVILSHPIGEYQLDNSAKGTAEKNIKSRHESSKGKESFEHGFSTAISCVVTDANSDEIFKSNIGATSDHDLMEMKRKLQNIKFDENCVILTSQSDMIQRVSCKTTRPYKSWSSPRQFRFASPVVGIRMIFLSEGNTNSDDKMSSINSELFYTAKNYLYALMAEPVHLSAQRQNQQKNESWIYFWDENDQLNANSVLKKKIPFKVKGITAAEISSISNKGISGTPVLLIFGLRSEFLVADGRNMSSLLNLDLGKDFLSENNSCELVWHDIDRSDNLFFEGSLKIYSVISVREELNGLQRTAFCIHELFMDDHDKISVKLKSAMYIAGNNKDYALINSNQKFTCEFDQDSLISLNIHENQLNIFKNSSEKAERKILIPEIIQTAVNASILDVVSLGKLHLGLVYLSEGCSKNEKKIYFCVMDLQYGVIHQNQSLGNFEFESRFFNGIKSSVLNIHLETSDDEISDERYILIQKGSSVQIMRYYTTEISLLDAMKSYSLECSNTAQITSTIYAKTFEMIQSCKFASEIEDLFQKIIQDETNHLKLKTTTGVNSSGDGRILNPAIVEKIVQKTLESKELFSHSIIEYLISTKAFKTYALRTSLLEKLIDRKEFGLFYFWILCGVEISETELIQLVRKLLTEVCEEEFQSFFSSNLRQSFSFDIILLMRSYRGLFISWTDMFLQAMLSMRMTDTFISQSLGLMNQEQILKLLVYLIALMRLRLRPERENPAISPNEEFVQISESSNQKKFEMFGNGPRILSFERILSLISCIIDSNMTGFIMNQKYHDLVAELKTHLTKISEESNECEILSSMMKANFLKEGKKLPIVHRSLQASLSDSKGKFMVSKAWRKEMDRCVGVYGIEHVKWW